MFDYAPTVTFSLLRFPLVSWFAFLCPRDYLCTFWPNCIVHSKLITSWLALHQTWCSPDENKERVRSHRIISNFFLNIWISSVETVSGHFTKVEERAKFALRSRMLYGIMTIYISSSHQQIFDYICCIPVSVATLERKISTLKIISQILNYEIYDNRSIHSTIQT